jgi:2-(1,2-epoxy-1,2-dihydrophenyl)acetyl-CoA isomerase
VNVAVEPVDGGSIVRLNRPERANSLDRETVDDLVHALREVTQPGRSRFVVITGSGRFFCAGLDRSEVERLFPDRLTAFRGVWAFQNVSRVVRRLPVPVVSFGNGAMVGGGCGLFWAGDRSLAGEGFKLRIGFARLGLGPDMGVSGFAAERVGHRAFRRLYLTDPTIDAARARQLGLTDNQDADTCTLEDAVGLARQLAIDPEWTPRTRSPRGALLDAILLRECFVQSGRGLDLSADDLKG